MSATASSRMSMKDILFGVPETGKERRPLRERAVDYLEEIAHMDPAKPGKIEQLTQDERYERIRRINGKMIQIEVECDKLEMEHARLRSERERLQAEAQAVHGDHMQGWRLTAEPKTTMITVEATNTEPAS